MEWISVKDKLPEYTGTLYGNKITDVVLFTDSKDIYTGHLESVRPDFINEYWTDYSDETVNNVTHWMPLPELPKP